MAARLATARVGARAASLKDARVRIAALPGDGVRAEVIAAGLEVIGAIERVAKAGVRTPDLGGSATTAQVTRAVWRAID